MQGWLGADGRIDSGSLPSAPLAQKDRAQDS